MTSAATVCRRRSFKPELEMDGAMPNAKPARKPRRTAATVGKPIIIEVGASRITISRAALFLILSCVLAQALAPALGSDLARNLIRAALAP